MTKTEPGQHGCTATPLNLDGRQATIVLGGGGARGLAHLGAIQAIAESGLKIERLVGVSIGALAGALCSIHTDIAEIQNKVISLLSSTAFRRHQAQFLGAASFDRAGRQPQADRSGSIWYRQMKRIVSARRHLTRAARGSSALPAKVLRELVNSLVPDLQIEDLPIPLSIVAVDLLSGKRVVMESGSLRDAVQASASIPGVFPAVSKDGMLLCDVGVIDSLPTVFAHSHGPKFTVAVDVGRQPHSLVRCESAIEAILRMQSLAEQELRRSSLQLADIVLRPGAENAWYDFSEPEHVIRSSYRNITEQLKMYQRRTVPDVMADEPSSSSLLYGV